MTRFRVPQHCPQVCSGNSTKSANLSNPRCNPAGLIDPRWADIQILTRSPPPPEGCCTVRSICPRTRPNRARIVCRAVESASCEDGDDGQRRCHNALVIPILSSMIFNLTAGYCLCWRGRGGRSFEQPSGSFERRWSLTVKACRAMSLLRQFGVCAENAAQACHRGVSR